MRGGAMSGMVHPLAINWCGVQVCMDSKVTPPWRMRCRSGQCRGFRTGLVGFSAWYSQRSQRSHSLKLGDAAFLLTPPSLYTHRSKPPSLFMCTMHTQKKRAYPSNDFSGMEKVATKYHSTVRVLLFINITPQSGYHIAQTVTRRTFDNRDKGQ